MRTFIAVDLTSEIKRRIADLVHRLKFAAPRGIGWANIADLHVTLKFLGEIGEATLPDIQKAVSKAASSAPSFPLSVYGTGTFPPGSRRPRVLWVGLRESPPLLDLHGRIENLMTGLGFPAEERAFRPHLTIGRVKSWPVTQALIGRLDEYRETLFGDLSVREVAVYHSVLHPQGAEHTILFREALRP
ncbi:MAG: RNA 2',3'-cyclic phosphodiesterase [Candidatus Aminicenantes bacterium]|nr:RNA 2',3'-cyclic phosphodiesterase [Candidatus Aminicenantes bacterium]